MRKTPVADATIKTFEMIENSFAEHRV